MKLEGVAAECVLQLARLMTTPHNRKAIAAFLAFLGGFGVTIFVSCFILIIFRARQYLITMVAKRAVRPGAVTRRPLQYKESRPTESGHPRSLKEAAYAAIRHRIITCAFKPGEFINEAQVSALLGIGRTPVHQAIDRLMLDGMVTILPRKGVCVKPISVDEILAIIDIRLINEVYCVRLAAEKATPDDIAHLADVLARARQWIDARSTEQLMLLDGEFHSVLARAARNPILGDILGRLHDRSSRFWFLSLDRPGHHENVQKQHEAILRAIKARNPAAAEEAMRRHIEAFRQNIFETLARPSDVYVAASIEPSAAQIKPPHRSRANAKHGARS